tara:strand:- start:1381 stop:1716 length:336 start_codon:yes stop_codon:yes gene_type:complete
MNEIKRKYKDNISNQIRYYKKKYGYDLEIKDYKDFKKHLNIIKKIYFFHDFICDINQFKIPYHFVELYAKNYNIINLGFTIKPYLQKLKKSKSEFIIQSDNINNEKHLLTF